MKRDPEPKFSPDSGDIDAGRQASSHLGPLSGFRDGARRLIELPDFLRLGLMLMLEHRPKNIMVVLRNFKQYYDLNKYLY